MSNFFYCEKENIIELLKNDYEKAEYLQDLMINHSTGGSADNDEYKELRKYFFDSRFKDLLPNFIISKRDLNQYWSYIKGKFPSYKERREFIYDEFSKILEFLEQNEDCPLDEGLKEEFIISSSNIHSEWEKALKRKTTDPEGAITMSRTLLESVLKHILDELNIQYTKNSNFSELYRKVSNELNLSPDSHNEKIFKQILGGCSGVINGLALLRNNLGDAHGGKKINPGERHSELAINLSGAISVFLLKTFKQK